jgi:2-dehydropantoate 2-reductase
VVSTQPPVTIVGAGGIGCALADALLLAGWAVTMVESDRTKVDWCTQHGIGYEDGTAHDVPIIAFDEWTPPESGLVILCVKCFDNADVLATLPDTVELIPVQNGFDERLIRRCRYEGIASFVSECRPARTSARFTRDGDLHLGPCRDGEGPLPDDVAALAEALAAHARFPVVTVEHVLPYKYSKLMYNAAISPLAAVTGLDNGSLLTHRPARRLFFQLLKENYRILHAAGIELETIGPFHPSTVNRILRVPLLASCMAPSFARSLKGTYCSMSGDIEAGRTEIDNFNGHLLALAGSTPCPLNRAACDLVHRMADERATPSLDRLQELAP